MGGGVGDLETSIVYRCKYPTLLELTKAIDVMDEAGARVQLRQSLS